MFNKLLLVLFFVIAAVGVATADFGVLFRGGMVGGSSNYAYYLYNTYIPYDNTGDLYEASKGNAYPDKDLTDTKFTNIGAEIFSETKIGAKSWVGIRGGYVQYGKDVLYDDFYYLSGYYNEQAYQWETTGGYSPLYTHEIKSEAYAVPVMAYYKYDVDRVLSVSGGLGIAILVNKWTETIQQNASWNYIAPVYDIYDDYRVDIPNTTNPYSTTDELTETKTMFLMNLTAEARIVSWFSIFIDVGYQTNGNTNFKTIERDFSGLFANVGLKVYAF